MSGFEVLTITFSLIVGLGMARVLTSVAQVLREHGARRLHWIPFSVALIVIFFQVQFWFGLTVVNSIVVDWAWPVYGLMLALAMVIFLAGATVLPPELSIGECDLIDDFNHRGRLSLIYIALYLVGWIGIGIMYWQPEMMQLVIVNGVMAMVLYLAYRAPTERLRTILHLVLILMTIFGALTVWTAPDLRMPMQ